MQIFRNRTYVTGIEYRDAEGQPRDNSIIIPDDSAEAQKIIEGFEFAINDDDSIRILQVKKPEAEEAIKKKNREEKRAEKRAAVLAEIIAKRKAKQTLTAKELQDAVDILLDAVFAPDEE